jgi:hypothetical protein
MSLRARISALSGQARHHHKHRTIMAHSLRGALQRFLRGLWASLHSADGSKETQMVMVVGGLVLGAMNFRVGMVTIGLIGQHLEMVNGWIAIQQAIGIGRAI